MLFKLGNVHVAADDIRVHAVVVMLFVALARDFLQVHCVLTAGTFDRDEATSPLDSDTFVILLLFIFPRFECFFAHILFS